MLSMPQALAWLYQVEKIMVNNVLTVVCKVKANM